jgi:hypothetical protein
LLPLNATLVARALGVTARQLLAAVWRPLVAAAIMYGATVLAQPPIDAAALTAGRGLMLLAIFVPLGAATYIAAELALWMLCRRPSGAEATLLAQAASHWRRMTGARRCRKPGPSSGARPATGHGHRLDRGPALVGADHQLDRDRGGRTAARPGDYGIMSMAMLAVGLVRMVDDIGLDAVLVQDRGIAGDSQARLAGLAILIGASASRSWRCSRSRSRLSSGSRKSPSSSACSAR